MVSLLQHGVDVSGFLNARRWTQFFAVTGFQMWTHIIRSESQVHLEVPVAKYLLFIAENRVRELGMEGADKS